METFGFPGGAVGKELTACAGDAREAGSFPGSGRSPGVECGNPFPYFYLENSMGRGVWWAYRPPGSKRIGHA